MLMILNGLEVPRAAGKRRVDAIHRGTIRSGRARHAGWHGTRRAAAARYGGLLAEFSGLAADAAATRPPGDPRFARLRRVARAACAAPPAHLGTPAPRPGRRAGRA